MSQGLNIEFKQDAQRFVRQNFLTALGIGPLTSGHAAFDLTRHVVNGNQNVAILRSFSPLDPVAVSGGEMPLFGYWVPQGGSCEIPATPGAMRSVVFTPDFSGCSIMVDQIDAQRYRVFHVQGGGNYLQTEYLQSPHRNNILGQAASMTLDDYGNAQQPRAFAFLKYEANQWWIHVQGQTGVGLGWVNGQLHPIGDQLPRGSGRIPVANLLSQVPGLNGTQVGH